MVGFRTAFRGLTVAVCFTVLAGCGGGGSLNAASTQSRSAAGVSVPGGFEAVELITGLRGPTQMAIAPDGRLLIAELAGGEGAGSGRILAFAPEMWAPDPDPDRAPGTGNTGAVVAEASGATVLFDGLNKPTGVAVAGGQIWVMEERTLSSGPLEGGALAIVLDDLPYNGRSEGTLTTTPDGRLLYNTSGSISGGEVVPDSGVLWSLLPGAGNEPEPYAAGFKHAYARTFDSEGRLWQTEMSDGSYDGQASADELVQVEVGDDFGWPQCVDDGRVVLQYGGTEEVCAAAPGSLALFEPGATPTAVAVAPWDDEVLLVALWNRAVVVAVPAIDAADEPVNAESFLRGMEHPQDLLAAGERLLVTDHESGRVVAIIAADSN